MSSISILHVATADVVGGSIILDDYHSWGGCRKATDQYLLGVAGQFESDDSAGSMKVTRTTSN